jgi:hypothetical protein
MFMLGTSLTAGVTLIGWLAWGRAALMAMVTFGLVGTVIQMTAVRALKPAMAGPFPVLVKRWAVGMGLRLLGIVLFAAAVVIDPVRFPPLPTALGYLGVVVPSLFVETVLAK